MKKHSFLNISHAVVVAALACVFASATHAAVTVFSSGGSALNAAGNDTANVTVSGINNMLVVGVSSEGNGTRSITWGTETPTASYIGTSGGNHAAIYVFSNLTAGTATLTVGITDSAGGEGFQFGYLSLTAGGALSVAQSKFSTGVDSASTTLAFDNATDGSLVFGVGVGNSLNNVVSSTLATNLFINNAGNGGWSGTGDYDTAPTGTDFTWTQDSGGRLAASAISITAVPEPSAVLLGGLGTLLLLRRRRN